jgi:hypothetical protein
LPGIEATLAKGSKGDARLDRLKALRKAGESYSDVILRLAKDDKGD